MKGKTIRIYLVDGVATGILTAEIINWTGKVFVGPRSQLAEFAKRGETKRTGIYCLVGPDPQQPDRDRVYIGEGDNVLNRLLQHDKDEAKDFWTRTVVVISKDENLTKAHVRYLESRLIQMGQEAGRALLANGTNPPPTPLPESDVADMEFFLEQVQLILPVLGFGFLQPKPVVVESGPVAITEGASPIFALAVDTGVSARGREVNGEFIVLAGSTARKQGVASWTAYRSLRDELVKSSKLVDGSDPNYYVLAEDIAFSSPSAAAAVCAGRNANGRIMWRVEGTGKTYQQWAEQKLERAENESAIVD